MAGVKGRSGRKPLLEEKKVEEILQLSSDVVIRWLSNPEVSDDRKILVASQLVSRRIPTTLDADGLVQETRVIIVRSNDSSDTAEKRTDVISERLEGSAQALAG